MINMGVSLVPWGILSTVGNIKMHVGDIMSTVGMFSTVGIPFFVI